MSKGSDRAVARVEREARRNPDVVSLATLASLAVRIESSLLRHLRLRFLSSADVGVESDLWFGPLVESRGARAIVLNRSVADVLRPRLAANRALFERVIALTAQVHRNAPSTLRLEERLTALALLDDPDVPQAIDEALRPALATLNAGGEEAHHVAQWASRALARAHPKVLECRNAVTLALLSSLQLGGRRILSGVSAISGEMGDMSWLLRAARRVGNIKLGVALVPRGVAFSDPRPGLCELQLPDTHPPILALEWVEGDQELQIALDAQSGPIRSSRLVSPMPGTTVDLGVGVNEVTIRTLTGDSYVLSPARPSSGARGGSVAPRERVHITYPSMVSGSKEPLEVELPLKLLVIGDFVGHLSDLPLSKRRSINVDKECFHAVLADLQPWLDLSVANLTSDQSGELRIHLDLRRLGDFEPQAIVEQVPELSALMQRRRALTALKAPVSGVAAFRRKLQSVLQNEATRSKLRDKLLVAAEGASQGPLESTSAPTDPTLDELVASTGLAPPDEDYALLRFGVRYLLIEMLDPNNANGVDALSTIDAMVAALDASLSRQVDAVLHHPAYQRLESTWRGLKFLVDRTNFRENIKIEIWNCCKHELIEDFAAARSLETSALYWCVYTTEYGQYGGKPYGAMLADFAFGPEEQDIALLGRCTAVASVAYAPFLAAAAPEFFGSGGYAEIPNLRDLRVLSEDPRYTSWQSFRESEDSRFAGLCLPRFLLRLPYGEKTSPVESFAYEEDVIGKHESYLWGSSVFALATRLVESFSRYRWCPNIIGPEGGGTVVDLPLHQYEFANEIQTKVPSEVLIGDRREFELSEEGFIPLMFRIDADSTCFYSANSTQMPKKFGMSKEGKDAELNYRLGTQLPYLFVASRFVHYLRIVQREHVGTWKEREQIEAELNKWLSQFVADWDSVAPSARSRCPLRVASLHVAERPEVEGYYAFDLKLRPNFKYMGAFFDLSAMGKLDRY